MGKKSTDKFLPEFSKQGSRDDVAIASIFNMEEL
jgi:flagellar basal body P-ring protein FlgI